MRVINVMQYSRSVENLSLWFVRQFGVTNQMARFQRATFDIAIGEQLHGTLVDSNNFTICESAGVECDRIQNSDGNCLFGAIQ